MDPSPNSKPKRHVVFGMFSECARPNEEALEAKGDGSKRRYIFVVHWTRLLKRSL